MRLLLLSKVCYYTGLCIACITQNQRVDPYRVNVYNNIHTCIFVYNVAIYMYMTEAPRVLHFSAFMISQHDPQYLMRLLLLSKVCYTLYRIMHCVHNTKSKGGSI